MAEHPVALLHLVDTLKIGGTERQLVEQLRFIDRTCWRPIVGSFHQEGELVGIFAKLGVAHASFPLRRSLVDHNTIIQIGRLALWCRREGVRIIHAHDFYANVVGSAVAQLAGTRFIASRRDLAHWLGRGQRLLLGVACRSADRVVANAAALVEATARDLRVDHERILLVPNGLDLERFDREASYPPLPPLPPRSGQARLAVVSSMHAPHKGHADLLAAVAKLLVAGKQLDVVLVGDGIERPRLQRLASDLGLSRQVHFLGRRTDVARILSRVDLACLPSWAEGFPNAVMEAMASRLPVVATSVGGCPELITHGESGLLVEPRQPDALAGALIRLLDDTAAAQAMGRRARQVIESRYSMTASAQALDALYRALLMPKRAA